ncbi:DUF805 domain-containing protein [Arthrobacter cupressi]|uniref:Uncharacterized membrane protein YhaH, DUF805 family n=1 Tax=Arthrobacter cupressi TaxID=1045773 RepID=A0A1G8PB82_9MICC|nr:DUF805 domain-containing protein [Arthrobacter cupressi]NYD76781.1 uncharacterized membrane protein YhaH (DUF805 family) [Arthrobacter cupressi]SDI89578.1 Uncharacterized membrane protein YhaH, DUF805 family [Arthrobacter cupressi]
MSYENPAGQAYSGQASPYAQPRTFAPRAQVGFVEAIKQYYRRYAEFTGRSNRSEYWWVALYQAIVSFVLWIPYSIALGGYTASVASASTLAEQQLASQSFPAAALIFGALGGIWALAHLVPNLAVTVRRLHDTGRSGWFILLGLIPFAGGIILLVLTVIESKPEGARYGA